MIRRVFETWEELPIRKDGVDRFEVPSGVGTVFLVQYETEFAQTVETAETRLKAIESIMDGLTERDPAAFVIALPSGWAFRVVKIGDEELEEDAA